MTEWLSLMPALMAGLALGIFYFGGLWLTVQWLPAARRPALLTLSSLAVRLSLTLLTVYLVTEGQWARTGVCLLGFFVMRTILVQRWRPKISPTAGGRSNGGT